MLFNAVEYIKKFSRAGKAVNNLSRIERLLEKLDNPHIGQKFVHIAGTNGKGSTLEYMSDILINAGYKTGQFTSPFIEKYNDRIRINNISISDEKLNKICLKVKSVVSDECLSQFEITFAIALIYFLEEKCDIVFLETGIGGALDATNVISSPVLSVITSVSFDHTEILGNTIKEIAVQKSGIIKDGCPVILSADNIKDTIDVVRNKAEQCHSRFAIPVPNMCVIMETDIFGSKFLYKSGEYRINMCGRHQVSNAITAIESMNILKEYGYKISDENIKNGLEAAKVKLRVEILNKNPLVIADGGHNISGIDSLIDVIKKLDRPVTGIVGMVKGKAAEYAGKKLSEVLDNVICADGYIENNIAAEDLKKYFTCPCECADYKAALKKALKISRKNNSAVLICGSLYLSSAVRHEFFGLTYEKLSEDISVCVSKEHRFGTDAFLLTNFSEYKAKDIACDLGTGCGIIPMIMQRQKPPAVTYAVDIQPNAIEQLRLGIEKSNVQNIIPVCADLKKLWKDAPFEKCSLVICNPPYKAAGAGIESSINAQKIARHEILCNINDVCHAASKLLKFGGRLCLCSRPERLGDVITAMKNNHIEPKRLRFVSKNPQSPPWLFLIEGKKGSKPFMKVMSSLYVWNENGYTDEIQDIYAAGKEENQ